MAEVHVALAAETLFHIGPLPITNSILTTWIVTAILLIFAYLATKKISLVPSPIQNFAEAAIDALRDLVESIAGEKTKIFLPFIASFFFFIIVGNYFGLLPGVGSIGFWEESNHAQISNNTLYASTEQTYTEGKTTPDQHQQQEPAVNQQPATTQRTFVPFLRSINSDLNTTLALAIVSIIATHWLAIKFLGLGGYLGKFFSLNPIFLFVGILEFFGELTKVLSLSFRLFGNIFAGEVLLTTATTNIFAYVIPIPFYFLELLVGFVQALIFAMLTLVFMVILTQKAHH